MALGELPPHLATSACVSSKRESRPLVWGVIFPRTSDGGADRGRLCGPTSSHHCPACAHAVSGHYEAFQVPREVDFALNLIILFAVKRRPCGDGCRDEVMGSISVQTFRRVKMPRGPRFSVQVAPDRNTSAWPFMPSDRIAI